MKLNTDALSWRDSFNFRMLVDEGLLIGRILNHYKHFPQSSACLALVAFPFLTVVEHDSIPFLNRRFGLALQPKDRRLTIIRHMTKSLNSKSIDFFEYEREAHEVIGALNRRFYSNIPWLGSLIRPFQKNVGIAYFNGIPAYATYSVAHLLTKNSPALLGQSDHTFEKEIGYEAGVSGAMLFKIADCLIGDHKLYEVPEFVTYATDWKYEDLAAPLKNKGVEDDAVFFFFSELLLLLSSVSVLRQSGFLEDAAYLKFSSLSLDHVTHSIDAFSAYGRSGRITQPLPKSFLDEVGALLARADNKFVKKAHPLRNAMMHYDFNKKLVPDSAIDFGTQDILSAAAQNVLQISGDEYANEVYRIRDRLIQAIAELISFPEYDSVKSPRKL